MKLKFGQYYNDYGAELLCPRCSYNYLHHSEVDVFERNEDATTGLHVHIVSEKVSTDTSLQGNPSIRRNGLSIGLWCESCRAKLILTLAQHKGVTLVDIIDTGENIEQA
jgi:hypothetical protein